VDRSAGWSLATLTSRLVTGGLQAAVCTSNLTNPVTAYWAWLFTLSKVL
jgi:hypothetical protein